MSATHLTGVDQDPDPGRTPPSAEPTPPNLATSGGRAYRWSFVSLAVRVALQAVSGIVIAKQIGPGGFGSGMLVVSIYGVVSSLVLQGANGTLIIRRVVPRRMFAGILGIDAALGVVATTGFVLSGLLASSTMRISLLTAAAGCAVQVVSGPGLAMSTRGLRFGRISAAEVFGAVVGTSIALVVSTQSGSFVALPLQMVVIDVCVCLVVSRSLFAAPATLAELASADVGYRYGLQTAGNQLASTGARNADNYLVAAFLGHTALGMYVLAYRLMMMPIQNISMVLTRVLVPRLRHLAGEPGMIAVEVRRLLLAIALPVGAMTGAVLPFVSDLLTGTFGQQYGGAIRPTEVLLLATFPQCCVNVCSCVLAATGHGRRQLRLTTTGLLFAVLAVVVGFPWGISGVTIVYALLSVMLAVMAVLSLSRLELTPVAPFAEALRYFLLVAALGAAGSLVWRSVAPTTSLAGGLAQVLYAAMAGVVLASLLLSRSSRTSLSFWRSVVQGRV